jgi:predicted RNA methylase
MALRAADGSTRPVWPYDEPFRLAEPTVLQTALALVNDILGAGTRVADPLGTAFDAFLSGRYDHSGGLGTYLTPSSVARMMADVVLELLPPNALTDVKAPVIADPFCGTGRFLVAAFDAAEERHADIDLAGLLDGGLVGADQSTSAIAKSGLNLLLYGAQRPEVYVVADSMTDPGLDRLRGTLTAVLTNPPFGGGKYADALGIRRTSTLFPSIRPNKPMDPAVAGLALSLELLRPGGVLGIVLPEGIVNGRQFQDILSNPNFHVVASVSLPTVTFALSGTVAKTSAVFIRRVARGERTVLARVDHVGFIKQAGRAVSDPMGSEIPAVAKALVAALRSNYPSSEIETVSAHPLVASVPSDGLTSVDPNRLDPEAVKSRHELLAAGGVSLRTLLTTGKKRRVRRGDGVPFVSVLHVDAFGTVDWSEAGRYEPITSGQAAESGDVLVSLLNPSKLRAAVIWDEAPQVECSVEFGVFQTPHDPYAILGLLYAPQVQAQLRPLGSGTSSSRRRISPEDVLDLVVPLCTDEQLADLGARVKSFVSAIEKGRVELDALYKSS